ncbi:MAG: ABC transporter ATP-binding protein [Candidatus Nanopelagicales bacterium]
MTDPILAVEDLTVRYGGANGATTAVNRVSFQVARGEVFGLVGESGSGKSSVCTALMRLLPRSAHLGGVIRFEGKDLVQVNEKTMRAVRGRRIALVPQQPMTSLSPTSSIGRQMGWYLGDLMQDEQARDTLTSIGLGPVLDRSAYLPQGFSGGQLQRLLIAIATLAHQPCLLLADEPTTTLDATVQAQVLRLLLDMRTKLNLSILYVSHDLAVIAQVCDRVGVMYGGRLVEIASVEDLFDAPKHPYTQALIAAMPSSSPRHERLHAIPGVAAGANRLPGCPFAPRCPRADTLCRTTMPEPEMIGATTVCCHHVEVRA